MKIEKVCNLLETTKFASKKDSTKEFYNTKLLADDIVIDCAFISKSAYEILASGQHLQQVKCRFDLTVSGSDNTGKTIYTIRLTDVLGFVK